MQKMTVAAIPAMAATGNFTDRYCLKSGIKPFWNSVIPYC
jgi:hypothetical protein